MQPGIPGAAVPDAPEPFSTTPERDELKARYAAAVGGGSRLLAWWLMLIVVLAVVVVQEIRDRERRTRLLAGEVTHAQERSREARREMGLLYDRIGRGVLDRIQCDSAVLRAPPVPSDDDDVRCTPDPAGDRAVWTAHLAYDTALLDVVRQLQPAEVLEEGADAGRMSDSLRAIATRVRRESGDTVRRYPETFPRTVPLPGVGRVPDPAVRGWADDFRSFDLSRIARQLERYHAGYARYNRARAGIQPEIDRIRRLSAEEQSLPTPFGGFNVDPRFALLGLAAAALLTYVAFLRRGVQARESALAYAAGSGGEPIAPPPGAPAWLFGGQRELPHAVGWSGREAARKRGIATLLHGAWVLVIGWLVREVLVLEASRVLQFRFGRWAGYALAVGLFAAAAFAIFQLLPRAWRRHTPSASPGTMRRRQFLAAIAASAAAVALGGAWWLRSGTRRARPGIPAADLAGEEIDWWYVNPRTGVVHCEPVCEDHVAGLEPLNGFDPGTERALVLHRGREALTLEALAMAAAEAGRRDAAIQRLQQALEYEPHSFRLYDALVKLFGAPDGKDYGRILPLLQGGLEKARSLPQRRREKAVDGFELRIRRVEERRREAQKRYEQRMEWLRSQLEPVG
ncbi:MAG TPA: hypothetical protein VFQ45_04720 [Longimicrobium sp.]|nr:hypothetical protein [Longimicrobium sp.]